MYNAQLMKCSVRHFFDTHTTDVEANKPASVTNFVLLIQTKEDEYAKVSSAEDKVFFVSTVETYACCRRNFEVHMHMQFKTIQFKTICIYNAF